MPGGKEHHKIWKEFLPLAAVGGGAVFVHATATTGDVVHGLLSASAVLAGYMVGNVVSPDLDLISIDRGEALAIRSVIFLPLVAWSTMYARIMQGMGGHRSFWSHAPLISTFIRLCWFAFPFVVALLSAGIPVHAYGSLFLYLWLGTSLADTLHTVADVLDSIRPSRKRGR